MFAERKNVIMRCVFGDVVRDMNGRSRSGLMMSLLYDARDPLAVELHVSSTKIWHLARSMLWHGCLPNGDVGEGDVHVARRGSDVLVTLSSVTGSSADISFVADDVTSFLLETYRLVPVNRESELLDVDKLLVRLLQKKG